MVEPITELEWAYLAGIIDGEGCITLSLRKYRKPDAISLRVMVYNTDKNLIDWIHERFGGSVHTHIREGENIGELSYGRRTVYKVYWCSVAETLRILRGIAPYLITKKWVADAVIGLLTLPKDMVDSRLKLFNSIKEVQHYG